jgi:hypothetical protein
MQKKITDIVEKFLLNIKIFKHKVLREASINIATKYSVNHV